MRERGDRLADTRQPLRLHHRRIVGRVLHGQGGLVPDGDHQFEVLVGEPPLPRFDRFRERHHRVDVHHAHGAVTALHRHADRLPHAGAEHAVARAEAVVVLCVAREHALAAIEHVVENRATDGHRRGVADLAVAAGLGPQLLRLRIEQHHAAAIRLHPFEDQLQNTAEQLVDVERVADRQRRAIHHLHIAAGPRQPAVLGVVGGEDGQVLPIVAHRADDPRALVALGCDDVDQPHRRHLVVLRVDHDGPPDLNLVAACQFGPLHLAVVEVGAVGALQVAHDEARTHTADFRMPPGNLVVIKLHEIPRLPPDAHGPFVGREIVTGAFVETLDDEQRRHGQRAPEGNGGDRGSRSQDTSILSQAPPGGKRIECFGDEAAAIRRSNAAFRQFSGYLRSRAFHE